MKSNRRSSSGWMRRSLRGAEELPTHARGRVFLVNADWPRNRSSRGRSAPWYGMPSEAVDVDHGHVATTRRALELELLLTRAKSLILGVARCRGRLDCRMSRSSRRGYLRPPHVRRPHPHQSRHHAACPHLRQDKEARQWLDSDVVRSVLDKDDQWQMTRRTQEPKP